MLALRVTSQYEQERSRYGDQIQRHRSEIDKAVDLFSRIKTTEQAEEMLTVLFASRQLEEANRSGKLAEQDLYDYILDWKKSWRTDEKRHALASAIRNLVLLGWLPLDISESLEAV
jgi:hypothetical protein